MTQSKKYFLFQQTWKPRKKILVASNSNRGNGDNFTAENEMGKPSRKPLVCQGIKNLHPEWKRCPLFLPWQQNVDIPKPASQRNLFFLPEKYSPWNQKDFLHERPGESKHYCTGDSERVTMLNNKSKPFKADHPSCNTLQNLWALL